MKKSYIFFIIVLILIGIGVGIFFYNSKKNSSNSNDNYSSSKLSTTENETSASTKNSSNSDTDSQNASNVNDTSNSENNSNTQETETQIADFTTKIYTKDSERQNNISITCSSLNDTIVNPGDTFSFCNTVGKATSSKGYEKADVFKDGEKVKALGGGNCQVSSTLYNAVLKVPELNVTERHEHSNTVPYVSKGQDAAVSYR